jgi:hypothetical protein
LLREKMQCMRVGFKLADNGMEEEALAWIDQR